MQHPVTSDHQAVHRSREDTFILGQTPQAIRRYNDRGGGAGAGGGGKRRKGRVEEEEGRRRKEEEVKDIERRCGGNRKNEGIRGRGIMVSWFLS